MPNASLPPGPAPQETLTADFCVVGGGLAGLCAALAAARGGARVVLLQNRPMLGGNASSEVRMWVCGAAGKEARETGLLEEIQLANRRHNPELTYTVWDAVLFGLARAEPNLTLLLNCAVGEVEMAGPDRIRAVRGWHLTRQKWIRVEAALFADCSGDSVLRLSGAPARWGREARDEFGECHAPAEADRQTMGNSILLQLREIDPADHRPFVPPPFARRFDGSHPRLAQEARPTGHNFWWLELGGTRDTIEDSDAIRDDLLALALGVWAFIKNHPDDRGHRWTLEWVGSLPGKRENVRYEGDHLLTQNDIEACGPFPDVVAHGGWPMDDHPPLAFEHPGPPTTFHPAPSPYGIPYRCLYSRTVENLFFAGRNISATHLALSSTRVMGTCAVLGQAVGSAAALAVRHGLTPRQVGRERLAELQLQLLEDDQFLPRRRRPIPAPARDAILVTSQGEAEFLRDGIDRPVPGQPRVFRVPPGGWIEYRLAQPAEIVRVRLTGDSQLHVPKGMPCSYGPRPHAAVLPAPLPRDLRVEVAGLDGIWQVAARVTDNALRRLVIPVPGVWSAVRVVFERAWGEGDSGVHACDFGAPVLAGDVPEGPAFSRPITRSHGA